MWCRHKHRLFERRERHGVPVMHLVCSRCGHATPVMRRTEAETVQLATRVLPLPVVRKLRTCETAEPDEQSPA